MTAGVEEAERAPAKINLALHVVGRRADGYHLLESLTVFTRFGDKLTAAHAPGQDAFLVSGPFAGQVPTGGDNLVLKARDLLREAVGPAVAGPVALRLEKNLPAVSGIGGGSADAAAALRALARLWGVQRSVQLPALAGRLGSDVPMCLAARPLVARGIGEVLEPLDPFPTIPMVLVNPGVPIPTPDVYAALTERENPPLPPLPPRLGLEGLVAFLADTRNDLSKPAEALEPIVADVTAELRRQRALFARMSGSGATCFGIFPDAAAAEHAASVIRKSHPAWLSVATQTVS